MNTSHQNNDSGEIEFTDLIESAKKKAEDQILRACYTSVFEMSPYVDRFATWLLAGIGATAALTVTNLKSISSILPFLNIKIGLGVLTISALFGFLEKFLALNIQSTAVQELKLREIFKSSSEEFYEKIKKFKLIAEVENIDIKAEVDVKSVLDKFANAHPWYMRIQNRKNITAEEAQRRRLRRYYRQLTYTVLEFCGFLLFIIIVALSI
jgi:hypothetical protein